MPSFFHTLWDQLGSLCNQYYAVITLAFVVDSFFGLFTAAIWLLYRTPLHDSLMPVLESAVCRFTAHVLNTTLSHTECAAHLREGVPTEALWIAAGVIAIGACALRLFLTRIFYNYFDTQTQ